MLLTWIAFLGLSHAAAAAEARSVPDRHIPAAVMLELRQIEQQFRDALRDDCAPERCFANGCAYVDHITLDQPRAGSLPGLPADQGPGSMPPQDFLTRARCEFSHERDVKAGDVAKLARRLEKRLSRGWLSVSVVPQALEPIPKSLAEPAPAPEPEPEQAAPIEPEAPSFTSALALRQLWDQLLPHTPWMLAIVLLTLAILVLIWAGRRLSTPSIEERMLEAQLQSAPPPLAEPAAAEPAEAPPPQAKAEDVDFVEEQEQLWAERLERLHSNGEDDVIARLLREWLKTGEFPTLARALLTFGDKVSQAFEAAPELALKKVEFANYFRDVEEASLPSRAKFFRHLNQQAMASLLLSQEDVQLYRSLREDFGSAGFVSLMREIPPRHAALLFALMTYDQQHEVAPLLPAELRAVVARQLLASTRISLQESAYLAACLEAVQGGEALPPPPLDLTQREHGPPVDSASALSVLLPHVGGEQRAALFGEAMRGNGGAMPAWYEDIAFSHMLTALPEETRNDLLLAVDIRGLAAWLQLQPAEWRQALIKELSTPLQNALRASTATGSRVELVRQARRGQDALVAAFKTIYARQGIRFVDLVA